MTTDTQLHIGYISGCHGIRGGLRLQSVVDAPGWIETVTSAIQQSGSPNPQLTFIPREGEECVTHIITHCQDYGKSRVLLQLNGVTTRSDAEAWVGYSVWLDAEFVPPEEQWEYRTEELVGMTMVSQNMPHLTGTIVDVLSSTAAPGSGTLYLEVSLASSPNPKDTVLVPLQANFCTEVNLEDGVIIVNHLDSFFEEALMEKPDKPKKAKTKKRKKKTAATQIETPS